jgi:hypothetical protein
MSLQGAEQYLIRLVGRAGTAQYDDIQAKQCRAGLSEAFAHEALDPVSTAGADGALARYGEPEACRCPTVGSCQYRKQGIRGFTRAREDAAKFVSPLQSGTWGKVCPIGRQGNGVRASSVSGPWRVSP